MASISRSNFAERYIDFPTALKILSNFYVLVFLVDFLIDFILFISIIIISKEIQLIIHVFEKYNPCVIT